MFMTFAEMRHLVHSTLYISGDVDLRFYHSCPTISHYSLVVLTFRPEMAYHNTGDDLSFSSFFPAIPFEIL